MKVDKEKLSMVIKFLKELLPAHFYLGQVRKECGTVCCAIGWFPSIFPDECRYSDLHKHTPNEVNGVHYSKVVEDIIGIEKGLAKLLFSPCTGESQFSDIKGITLCKWYADPNEVAEMLEEFLELLDKGEIPGHE